MTVSIIIPVYNVAPYIEACLKSVMGQTYTGLMECIVVDDCGTDDSMAIVERVIAEYDGAIHFHIEHHHANRGLSAARNTGIAKANGEYLLFLDSDDEITADCIKLLMGKAAQNPDAEMIQGNAKTYAASSHDLIKKQVSITKATSNDEVRKCFFRFNGQMPASAWNKMLRRSFVVENELLFQEGVYYEDRLWTFYLLKHIKCACFLPEVTYLYRIRAHSIMTGTDSIVIGRSYRVIYHDIVTNLSIGHEKEELSYYAKRYAYYYTKFVKDIPEFKDDWRLYKEKAQTFRCVKVKYMLLLCRLFGKIKGSWMIIAFMKRLRHPSIMPDDMRRVKSK